MPILMSNENKCQFIGRRNTPIKGEFAIEAFAILDPL